MLYRKFTNLYLTENEYILTENLELFTIKCDLFKRANFSGKQNDTS